MSKKKKPIKFSKDAVEIFGRKVNKPKPGSKTYAGLAAASGAAMVASNFVPQMKPLSLAFKGAATVAIGAADAKRMAEVEKAQDNHKSLSRKLAAAANKGKVKSKSVPDLTDRDYIQLAFLTDKQLEQLVTPVQVEVLKTQIMLDMDTVRRRSLKAPEELAAYSKTSGHLHNKAGIEKLKKERTQVRDILDGKADGKFDQGQANANEKADEMKGIMRIGGLQALQFGLRRAGKIGKHISSAFDVVEAAQIMKEAGRLMYDTPDIEFKTQDEFLDYLEEKLNRSREAAWSPPKGFSKYLPKFGK